MASKIWYFILVATIRGTHFKKNLIVSMNIANTDTNQPVESPSLVGSQSETSGTNSSTSSSSLSSWKHKAKDNFTLFFTSVQKRQPREGKKMYILYLILNVYFMWCALFVPTLRNYAWGSYGSYLFMAINFPTTPLSYGSLLGSSWVDWRCHSVGIPHIRFLILDIQKDVQPKQVYAKAQDPCAVSLPGDQVVLSCVCLPVGWIFEL